MKVAISGSHGFIGSHLAEALSLKGYDIVPISQELLYSPVDLKTFFMSEVPEYIFHLATYGNMALHTDISMTVFANIIGTFNILHESQDIPYRKFIYMSTSSVLLPYQTFYSSAKLSGEHLCDAFKNEFSKPITIVRPSTIIGVGEQHEHFIPSLIRAALTGETLPFVSGPVHDYLDVSDLVSALEAIMKTSDNRTYEVGSEKQISNDDIKILVETLLNRQVNIESKKRMRKYDTTEWRIDTTTIKKLYWYPKKSIGKIIYEMIEYEKQKSASTNI